MWPGRCRLDDWRNPDIPNRADLHAALWAVFARRIPEGAAVTVINVVSNPELNGRTGKVARAAADDDAAGRIGVLVDGTDGPIRLNPNCVTIKQRAAHARPYSSLEALLKKHTTFDAADKEADLEEFTAISVRRSSCARFCACTRTHLDVHAYGVNAGMREHTVRRPVIAFAGHLRTCRVRHCPAPLHASLPPRGPPFPPSSPPCRHWRHQRHQKNTAKWLVDGQPVG